MKCIHHKIIIPIIILLVSFPAHAKRLHPEKWYQEKLCEDKVEFVLSDKTRVDCLTETYAIEFDFANKWAEAIGQSLHYSAMTGKQAGIVLIMENERDIKYLYRLKVVVAKHKLNIKVWTITEEKLNEFSN
jgi:hypothetical protein